MKVIPRIAVYNDKQTEALLFFPESSASYGRIECYAHIGQHNEAAMQFYMSNTRPAKTEAEKKEIADLLAEYAWIAKQYYNEELETQKRVNWNLVRKGWR